MAKNRASYKCDGELMKIVVELCRKKGLKVQYFVEEAVREKLEKIRN